MIQNINEWYLTNKQTAQAGNLVNLIAVEVCTSGALVYLGIPSLTVLFDEHTFKQINMAQVSFFSVQLMIIVWEFK